MEKYSVDSISRNTLSQQVMEQIVKLLKSGQLKPGDRLPTEMELMETLGVSRPVIREALSSLETLEIINKRPRGGTFINEKIGRTPFMVMLALSMDNLPAIVEARMALELGLVTLAAEKITEQDLERLQETIELISKSIDLDYGAYDREFHRIIAMSAKNQVVEGMIDSLLITHEKTDSLIKYREKELTVEHHKAIYEALAKRDPHESFQQMYRHLNYVRQKILKDFP